ncbi:MAG: DUF4194 domain-containing protein [Helicobacteraceae bacterium]|nr:DUF4194 domain-containing protein [Helicobacteraceae bacterium]
MNQDARIAIVLLLKGLFYKSDNEKAFFELINNSYGAISEYFTIIGLDVLIDENDGYAYLKNSIIEDEKESLPKLIQSRELSYKVSLLCLLLRKKIADFDMQNENERAIVTKEDISSLILLFLDIKFNEVKITKEIDVTIKKVQELGFLKKLKISDDAYEIKSSIKAFIDASWLDEFDTKLSDYKKAELWT